MRYSEYKYRMRGRSSLLSLSLMKMMAVMKVILMMMMMMTASVSAAPHSPILDSVSRDENITMTPKLHRDAWENSTSFEPGPDMNSTSPEIHYQPKVDPHIGSSVRINFCPTCGTVNLGSDLQRGDEKAGDKTKDPTGPGK
ncbi:uncharacterized protein zgc:193726 [Cheilinus undulatus]|uniref:uncharacterized protein zgc:193726 n=1 Tax=Cheilinus undulatus TaxID=241271 RepID=UPI001BD2EE0D|nr:uncharacterized protein zgc:193726 [Cheilinus undulatus]